MKFFVLTALLLTGSAFARDYRCEGNLASGEKVNVALLDGFITTLSVEIDGNTVFSLVKGRTCDSVDLWSRYVSSDPPIKAVEIRAQKGCELQSADVLNLRVVEAPGTTFATGSLKFHDVERDLNFEVVCE